MFAFVGDAANNPRWRSYVVATAWLDDRPMGVGRRGRQVSRLLGREYSVEAEIVTWDPPHQVVWRTVAGDARVRTDCRVEGERGGTRLTIGAEGEFTTPLLRMMSPLAIAVMKRQAGADMKRLKRLMENPRQATS